MPRGFEPVMKRSFSSPIHGSCSHHVRLEHSLRLVKEFYPLAVEVLNANCCLWNYYHFSRGYDVPLQELEVTVRRFSSSSSVILLWEVGVWITLKETYKRKRCRFLNINNLQVQLGNLLRTGSGDLVWYQEWTELMRIKTRRVLKVGTLARNAVKNEAVIAIRVLYIRWCLN